MNRIFAALLCVAFCAVSLAYGAADDISRLYDFQSGTTIQSSQVDAEFDQIISTLNNKAGRGVANTFTTTNTFSHSTGVTTDTITERTGSGVTIDGVVLSNSGATVTGLTTTTASTLTIATGAVTSTGTKHLLDTEGAAASDDLDTISGGADGRILILSTVSSSRDVVIKHNTGNIFLSSASDLTLGLNTDTIVLTYDSATSKWRDVKPAVTAPTEPGLKYLGTVTASASAAMSFQSYITSTYDEYEIHFFNIIPATDTADLHLLTSTDNGSTWDTGAANYKWAFGNDGGGGTAGNAGSTGDTKIKLAASLGNSTGESKSGWIKIYAPTATGSYHTVSWEVVGLDSAGDFGRASGGGMRVSTSDIDAVRLIMSTGNITSGFAHIYGLRRN